MPNEKKSRTCYDQVPISSTNAVMRPEQPLEMMNTDIKTCEKTQPKHVKYKNENSKEKKFMEGEEVIISMPDSTQKLTKRWSGPGVIHRKRSENTHEVMDE